MKVVAAAAALILTIGSSATLAQQKPMSAPERFNVVAPAFARYAEGPVAELWRRPGLAPRDRSLVTVSALVASGQVAQLPYHLDRAMNNGLTAEEAGEVLTQLAFYAGWPRVFSALPVVKDVIDKRPK